MRQSLKAFMRDNELDEDSVLEMAQEALFDGVCPALCTEGCEVEPDGTCYHGGPSLLIALKII